MNVTEFGAALVTTGDLDPVYLMLNAGSQDPDTTARWCLAFWMFYHAGVASAIAEHSGEAFWETVWKAQNDKWPRGTERRHFKAKNSQTSIAYLQGRFPMPEDAIGWLAGYPTWEEMVEEAPPEGVVYKDMMDRAQTWVGFGPWIAFKIADMMDCVMGVPVDFFGSEADFFEDPQKGAAWVHALTLDPKANVDVLRAWWEEMPKGEKNAITKLVTRDLLREFKGLVGPDGRPVRVQEVETVLCKYKSHLNGHYPIGKDTKEVLAGLSGWGKLATHLQAALRDATPQEHHGTVNT